MRIPGSIAGAVVCVLAIGWSARADIIILVNGGQLRGTIIERSGDTVRVKTVGGIITLKRSDILRIIPETGAQILERRR